MAFRVRWLMGLGLLVFMAGCASFPRIIVLHDPLTPQEHLQLAAAYESQAEWALAEKEYRAALDLDPHLVSAEVGLGNVYTSQKKFALAERHYRRALKQDPNHAMAANNLAGIYIAQGIRLNEAGELIDRALAADSRYQAFYLDTRALLWLMSGRIDQARAASIEAESAPGHTTPGFSEQHAETRSRIESAAAVFPPDRTVAP